MMNVKIENGCTVIELKNPTHAEASRIANQDCTLCPKKVDFTKFKSQSDHDEHVISGMCKTCMNKIFGYERRSI